MEQDLLKGCPPDAATKLAKLIADDSWRELDCRPFLSYIADLLCRETPNRLLRVGSEEPTRFGSSDYVVSAEISHGGISERVAYVWELKAPQVYLYEMDDNLRRFRPTADLVKAETQLLHYVSEYEDSKGFKEYYDLRPNSRILPAGIIIGRKDNFARIGRKGANDMELDQLALAQNSHSIREFYLYRVAGIRLKTWDWVTESLTRFQNGVLVPVR